MRSKVMVVIACGAVLALGACNTGGGGGFADQTRIKDLTDERDAARDALEAAQNALVAAQNAQRRVVEDPTDPQAQAALWEVLTDAENDVREVEMRIEEAPVTSATPAVQRALASTRTAIASVRALYPVSDRTDMHTPLDRARGAVAQALTHLADAREKLDEAPDDAVETVLAEAQAALNTAQLSLLPRLQQKLDEENARADAEKARADAAETERDAEKARADAAETERDAEKARAGTEKQRADTAEADLARSRAEIDRLSVWFGKDLALGSREASRVAPSDDASVTLTPRRDGVRVEARGTFVATSPSWRSELTHYNILDYGTASTVRLDIEQDPVAYSAGVAAVIPGASGGDPAAVEFPGRGQVFRGHVYDKPDFHLARQGSYGPSADGTAASAIPPFGSASGALRANLRGHAISSFQYRADGGLTMKFGGMDPTEKPAGAPAGSEGSLIFGDLEALTATAGYNCGPDNDQACDEVGTRDLTVSFGTPARDPTSEPAYYWTVDAPNPKLGIAAGTTADLDQWTRADTVGVVARYEMLLSNHAGVDDKGTAATDDDEERYLRYAAYGLFQALDYGLQSARPGRMQTLHYGYDAFGTHNPLPAATADSIAATFDGRTMAWLAIGGTGGGTFVTGLERMRGNVTLHACLGGSGCQASAFTAPTGAAKPTAGNSLTGAIWNLEISGPGGAWVHGDGAHPSGYHAFRGDLLLAGTVTANGAFSGTVTPDSAPSDSERTSGDGSSRAANAGPDTHGYTIRQQTAGATQSMSDYWAAGAFEGAFYGPADALEAAGTWWVPSVRAEVLKGAIGIIGSFGATTQPDE